MKCSKCGNYVSGKFCNKCGNNVSLQKEQQYFKPEYQPKKKSNVGLIITICILGIVAVAMIAWLAIIIFVDFPHKNKVENKTTSEDVIVVPPVIDEDEDDDFTMEFEDVEDVEDEYVYGHLNYSNDSYLYPSDERYITESELSLFSKDEVALIRNELYARHGYTFSNEYYGNYFAEKSWYRPNSSLTDGSQVEIYFNQYELENKKTLVQYEKDMGWR